MIHLNCYIQIEYLCPILHTRPNQVELEVWVSRLIYSVYCEMRKSFVVVVNIYPAPKHKEYYT